MAQGEETKTGAQLLALSLSDICRQFNDIRIGPLCQKGHLSMISVHRLAVMEEGSDISGGFVINFQM